LITQQLTVEWSTETPAGLNLRVAPHERFSLLALAVLLVPHFDKTEKFRMLDQKGHEVVTLTLLHRTAIMIERFSVVYATSIHNGRTSLWHLAV
jgi:hypothetical protein